MIMKKSKMMIVVMLLLAIPVVCAEIDGQWTGVADDQDGKKLEFRYRFRAEGNRLIGLIESRLGMVLISEGKIDGNNIEFRFQTGEVTVISHGTLSGDEIHLTGTNRTFPYFAAIFSVSMLAATEQGCCYTFDEVRKWMEGAGLGNIRRIELDAETELIEGVL